MKAATSAVDITPRGIFYLSGYRNDERYHPGQGVHDAAYAVMLYLADDEGKQALFVTIDVCHVARIATASMRKQLQSCLNIPEECIVIGGIHSHACSTGFNRDEVGLPETPGYNSKVTGLIVEAASTLPSRATEVDSQIMTAPVHGWYGERSHPERQFTDVVSVVRFVSHASGEPVAAMLNISCHSTVLGSNNMLLSPDLIGGVRREIGDWIGVTPLTFPGAAATISNRHFRKGNDFSELSRVVNGVAGCIMKGEFKPIELHVPSFRRFVTTISYDQSDYHDLFQKRLSEIKERLNETLNLNEETRKQLISEQSGIKHKLDQNLVQYPIEMTVADMGRMVLITFSGELEYRLGERVKKCFPDKHAMIMGYANDYRGYFIAEDSFGDNFESQVTECPRGMIEHVLDEFESWL